MSGHTVRPYRSLCLAWGCFSPARSSHHFHRSRDREGACRPSRYLACLSTLRRRSIGTSDQIALVFAETDGDGAFPLGLVDAHLRLGRVPYQGGRPLHLAHIVGSQHGPGQGRPSPAARHPSRRGLHRVRPQSVLHRADNHPMVGCFCIGNGRGG